MSWKVLLCYNIIVILVVISIYNVVFSIIPPPLSHVVLSSAVLHSDCSCRAFSGSCSAGMVNLNQDAGKTKCTAPDDEQE